MKKGIILLMLGLLLVLPGCGDTGQANTSTDVSVEESINNNDENVIVDIANCNVLITGFRHKFEVDRNAPSEYTMHMINPEVLEFEDDTLIAEGYLTDGYNIDTLDKAKVIYHIDTENEKVLTGELIDLAQLFTLTPHIPFDIEYMYTDSLKINFLETDKDNLAITKENFSSIELLDDFEDCFSYTGRILFTDKEGNKWVTQDDYGSPFTYSWETKNPEETGKWFYSLDFIDVIAY